MLTITRVWIRYSFVLSSYESMKYQLLWGLTDINTRINSNSDVANRPSPIAGITNSVRPVNWHLLWCERTHRPPRPPLCKTWWHNPNVRSAHMQHERASGITSPESALAFYSGILCTCWWDRHHTAAQHTRAEFVIMANERPATAEDKTTFAHSWVVCVPWIRIS